MSSPTVLDIAVVGGGLAGLAAALYLRKSGHRITIFERSAHFKEAGFAISVAPNGARVLTALGFDYAKAKAIDCQKIVVSCGITLQTLVDIPLESHHKRWGDRWVVLYRPDMHAELTRLALDRADQGPEIVMRLGVEVVKTDIVGGTIFFKDGSSFTADLIIGADGENSVVRQDESWGGNSKLLNSPIRVCRSITPTTTFLSDEVLGPFLRSKESHLSAFTDGKRILTWWSCRGGELQDLEAGYRVSQRQQLDQKESRRKLSEEYKDFHPTIKRALDSLATSSDWDINFTSPPIQWTYGKSVLIGDAMHSMFPTTGQGACQCLEDAAALGILLSQLRSMDDIPKRLEKFQALRCGRVVEIHALSSVLLGAETKLDEHVRSALPDGRVFNGPLEHLDVTNGYDVIRESNKMLLSCFEVTGENNRASL